MSRTKLEGKTITAYEKFLKENSRPPSRGGNTSALHSHVLEIEGEKYSFLSLGARQWVFKSDAVSFEYEVKDGYKNIIKETIVTIDRHGQTVFRGNRGFKKTLRTAITRMPGRQSE